MDLTSQELHQKRLQNDKEYVWALYEEDKAKELEHYVYDGHRYKPSLDEAFDPFNPRAIFYTWFDDHAHFLDQDASDKAMMIELEYHHLTFTLPLWLVASDRITALLSK